MKNLDEPFKKRCKLCLKRPASLRFHVNKNRKNSISICRDCVEKIPAGKYWNIHTISELSIITWLKDLGYSYGKRNL